MNDSLDVTMLRAELDELNKVMMLYRTAVSTMARNALTALEDGDEDECIELLKQISGDN